MWQVFPYLLLDTPGERALARSADAAWSMAAAVWLMAISLAAIALCLLVTVVRWWWPE